MRIVNPKRGTPRKIIVGDLELIAEYLGKGAFATAYRVDNRVYVFADDITKQAVAELRYMNAGAIGNPHIPEIENVGEDSRTGKTIFLMPYYEPLTSKHTQAWRDFRLLEKLWREARSNLDLQGRAYHIIENLPEGQLRDAISYMYGWALDYTSEVGIEIVKRNLGVKDGKLILRDILFDSEALKEIWRAKRAKREVRRRAW